MCVSSHTGYFNDHSRIHTGDKPYHCQLCDKQFEMKAHLKVHLLHMLNDVISLPSSVATVDSQANYDDHQNGVSRSSNLGSVGLGRMVLPGDQYNNRRSVFGDHKSIFFVFIKHGLQSLLHVLTPYFDSYFHFTKY